LQPLPMGAIKRREELIGRIARDAGLGKTTRAGHYLLHIW
jgi:hypothetical protein